MRGTANLHRFASVQEVHRDEDADIESPDLETPDATVRAKPRRSLLSGAGATMRHHAGPHSFLHPRRHEEPSEMAHHSAVETAGHTVGEVDASGHAAKSGR